MTNVRYDPNTQEAFAKFRIEHQGDSAPAGRKCRLIVNSEIRETVELPAMDNGDVHETEIRVPSDQTYTVQAVLDDDPNDQEPEDNETDEITYEPVTEPPENSEYNQQISQLSEVRPKSTPPPDGPDYTTPPDDAWILDGSDSLDGSGYKADDWTNVLRLLKDRGDPSGVTVWIDPAWTAMNGGVVRFTEVMGLNAPNFTVIGGGTSPEQVIFDGDKGKDGKPVGGFSNKLQSFNGDAPGIYNCEWRNAQRGEKNSCCIQLGYLNDATLEDVLVHHGWNGIKGSRINGVLIMRRCRFWECGNPNSSSGTHLVYITGDGRGRAIVEDCDFRLGRHYYNLKLRMKGENGPIEIKRTDFDGTTQQGACYENDAGAETLMEDCNFKRDAYGSDSKVIAHGTQSNRLVEGNLTLRRCQISSPAGDVLRIRTIKDNSWLYLEQTSDEGLELKDWGDRVQRS